MRREQAELLLRAPLARAVQAALHRLLVAPGVLQVLPERLGRHIVLLHRTEITIADIEYVLRTGSYAPRSERRVCGGRGVGRVNGLAVVGGNVGAVLAIEAVAFPAREGRGQWRATGIIEQEQLEAGARRMTRRSTASGAVENVRTALRGMGLAVDGYDVHIDFPGGMPVDGPSAGVAMAVAV